jgi:hypothetical protein
MAAAADQEEAIEWTQHSMCKVLDKEGAVIGAGCWPREHKSCVVVPSHAADKAHSLQFFEITGESSTQEQLLVGLADRETFKVAVDSLPVTLLLFAEGTEARAKLHRLYNQPSRMMWPVCLTSEERINKFTIPLVEEQHTREVPGVKGACIVQDKNEDVVGFQLDDEHRIMLTDETRKKFAAALHALRPPYGMSARATEMLHQQFPLE